MIMFAIAGHIFGRMKKKNKDDSHFSKVCPVIQHCDSAVLLMSHCIVWIISPSPVNVHCVSVKSFRAEPLCLS